MKKLISILFLTFLYFSLFSQQTVKNLIVISSSQNLSEEEKSWIPECVKDELELNFQSFANIQVVSSNNKMVIELQKSFGSINYDEESAIELGKLVSASHALFVKTRKVNNSYTIITEITDLTNGKLIAKSISSKKTNIDEITDTDDSAINEVFFDLCNKLGIVIRNTEVVTSDITNSYITLKNIDKGIKVTITNIGTIKDWTTGFITIMEDDNTLPIRYSFKKNNNLLIKEKNQSITFIYPFVTENNKYTFIIANSKGEITEKKSIKANKTSNLQINYNKLEENFMNLKLTFSSTNNKKIISMDKDPRDIFDGKTNLNIQYIQFFITLNGITNSGNYKWIYNFGSNNSEINALLNGGIDLMDKKNSSNLRKTPTQIRNELANCDGLLFHVSLQFSVEPFSDSQGSLLINLSSPMTFEW